MMPQFNSYKDIMQMLASVVAIIAAVGGAIIKFYKFMLRKKYHTETYYVSREVFSDRAQNLYQLVQFLKSDVQVINIYGRRGIGKSCFLRFYCDFTNHKLGKKNKKRKLNGKTIRPSKGHAFYLQLSGNGAHSVEEQIIQQTPGACSSLRAVAEHIAQIMRHGKIFIVIDNVNNAGLYKELERVIDIFLSYSSRYRIIVGSIEKQFFLNITNENQVDYIELQAFNETDIFDFAAKNEKTISYGLISQILDFTEGLPVFVSLLLNNSSSVLSSIVYNDKMDHYIYRIMNELEAAPCILAQYIGFLSITMPSFSTRILREVGISFSISDLHQLVRASLIEFEEDTNTIKMHELFRDYICRHYYQSTDIIQTIYNYFLQKGHIYEQAYYLVFIGNENCSETIIQAVENAIIEENYTFLLMLGEHYKNIYGLNHISGNMPEEAAFVIIYGYLEGLIGVGNYPAAQEVVDRCKISARDPQNDLQFRISMLTASLYHLQNNYEESISCYSILLDAAQKNQRFEKYEAKCLWGIAHAYRHQGKNYNIAIEYYDKSIQVAERLGRKSEVIKSMREKLIILLVSEQRKLARNLHQELFKKMKSLPPTSYTETRMSILKTEVDYMRSMSTSDCFKHENLLLQKVLSHYKSQNKRLQYNIYFQLGEIHRKNGNYKLARSNYNMSLRFSHKNMDHNLETLSLIALTICDFSDKEAVKSVSKEQLIQCIETCDQFDLNINKLLAEMLLSHINGDSVDGEVREKLELCNYAGAIAVCDFYNRDNLKKLNLFLM